MLLIKKVLHDKNLKQVNLSELTGINEATISLLVNGRLRPYPVQAKKIALALAYEGNPEELFSEVYDA